MVLSTYSYGEFKSKGPVPPTGSSLSQGHSSFTAKPTWSTTKEIQEQCLGIRYFLSILQSFPSQNHEVPKNSC